jgi:hypothetical protein
VRNKDWQELARRLTEEAAEEQRKLDALVPVDPPAPNDEEKQPPDNEAD